MWLLSADTLAQDHTTIERVLLMAQIDYDAAHAKLIEGCKAKYPDSAPALIESIAAWKTANYEAQTELQKFLRGKPGASSQATTDQSRRMTEGYGYSLLHLPANEFRDGCEGAYARITLNQLNFAAVLEKLKSATKSAEQDTKEFNNYLTDSKALRVLVQICLPDRTAFFESLDVDVTDMPAQIRRDEIGKMYSDAKALKTYDNPYKSSSSAREFQRIQQWRPSTSDTDFPKKSISFGKVSNVKGVVSDGGGSATLAGSTERNQPIFTAFSHERAGDLLAIHTGVQVNRDGVSMPIQYWFKLPKEIGTHGYTEWMPPLSEEKLTERTAKQPIFWLLTHGKELPIYPVGNDAPRIRYRLVSSEEYWKFNDVGRRAMILTRLKRLTSSTPLNEELFHLVPALHEAVPPC